MILIFDLDDTLYPEHTFVESGFRAVAAMLASKFNLDQRQSLNYMLETLQRKGRGGVFDELLRSRGLLSARLVQNCVQTYRQHQPEISLYPAARNFLDENRGRPMYLVTDGNKNVQARKVCSIGLDEYFKRVFITHRFGVHNAKPSTYCFDLIRKIEGCAWSDMAYIGDNPVKDFVNLNSLGMLTVRVMTGEHSSSVARPGFDARVRIDCIEELPSILNEIPR